MKKLILILLVITGITEGCKKYEDGPWISFISAKHRLYGNYTLTQYTVDGVDSLSLFNDSLYNVFQFFFDENTDLDAILIQGKRNDGQLILLDGNWKLIENNTIMEVKYSSVTVLTGGWNTGTGPFTITAKPQWEIIRLTNKEVKLKTNYNNKEYLIKLEAI